MSGAETFFVFKPVNYKKTGLDQFEELWYLSLVLQFNDLFISQITEHSRLGNVIIKYKTELVGTNFCYALVITVDHNIQ